MFRSIFPVMFSRMYSTRVVRNCFRRFSTEAGGGAHHPNPVNTPKPVAKNFLTAALLLGFVGAVYFSAISKMSQTVESSCLAVVFGFKFILRILNIS